MVLTASTALQYAYEGERDVRHSRAPAQPSVFTSAVAGGLRDGSADLDGDGFVSVDELYDYVHEQVRDRIARPPHSVWTAPKARPAWPAVPAT